MVSNFHMPPMGYGPGSQPPEEDGKELEYMPMPQDMRSYSLHVPEVEGDISAGLDLLAQMSAACGRVAEGEHGERALAIPVLSRELALDSFHLHDSVERGSRWCRDRQGGAEHRSAYGHVPGRPASMQRSPVVSLHRVLLRAPSLRRRSVSIHARAPGG